MRTTRFVLLFSALATTIGGGYWIWVHHWRTTPEYAVMQIKKAIDTHDLTVFTKYVDIDNLSTSQFEEVLTLVRTESQNFLSGVENKFLTRYLRANEVELIRDLKESVLKEIEIGKLDNSNRTLEDIDEEGVLWFFLKGGGLQLSTSAKNYTIDKEGKIAILHLPVEQSGLKLALFPEVSTIFDLQIIMRNSGGQWRVSEFRNFAEVMEKVMKIRNDPDSGYSVGTQIVEAVALTAQYKTWLHDYYSANGDFSSISISDSGGETSGKYVENVSFTNIAAGSVTILATFAISGTAKQIAGKEFAISTNDGGTNWVCGSLVHPLPYNPVPDNLLPSQCRKPPTTQGSLSRSIDSRTKRTTGTLTQRTTSKSATSIAASATTSTPVNAQPVNQEISSFHKNGHLLATSSENQLKIFAESQNGKWCEESLRLYLNFSSEHPDPDEIQLLVQKLGYAVLSTECPAAQQANIQVFIEGLDTPEFSATSFKKENWKYLHIRQTEGVSDALVNDQKEHIDNSTGRPVETISNDQDPDQSPEALIAILNQSLFGPPPPLDTTIDSKDPMQQIVNYLFTGDPNNAYGEIHVAKIFSREECIIGLVDNGNGYLKFHMNNVDTNSIRVQKMFRDGVWNNYLVLNGSDTVFENEEKNLLAVAGHTAKGVPRGKSKYVAFPLGPESISPTIRIIELIGALYSKHCHGRPFIP